MPRCRILSLLVPSILAAVAPAAWAGLVTLTPNKDNTLIQRTDAAGQLSNGQGDIFVGRTGQDGTGQTTATISIRRGLVAFDVAGSVPAGATVTAVSLIMRDVMGQNGDPTVELHRLLQDWGEGNSFQNGGAGAAAQQDDATWLYTNFNAGDPTSSPTWSVAGGSFDAATTASTVVSDDLGGGELFTWSSGQMVADVQGWLDNPGSNFGWLLKLADESLGGTAKRFNSGESGVSPNVPPALEITYHVPEPATWLLLAMGAASCAIGGKRGRRTR